jgi:antitoxin component of RelBE/YafQ-DinJ toxin-antitoxin module
MKNEMLSTPIDHETKAAFTQITLISVNHS